MCRAVTNISLNMAVRSAVYKYVYMTAVIITMINMLSFIIWSSDHSLNMNTSLRGKQEQEDVIEKCLDTTQLNRSVFSSPKIVDIYSDYVRCKEEITPTLNVIQSSINDDDGSLQISSPVDNIVQPSWSNNCSNDRLQILYLIVIKDRGPGGVQRRNLIREIWAGSLPADQRHVFVISGDDDVERESQNHDDILQLDLPGSGLHTEHKSLILALHFSHCWCWAGQHTILLDQTVVVSPSAMARLVHREKSAGNRVYGRMYRDFSPARHRRAEHFTSREDWPWQLFPPLLDQHVMAFSQDTIPLILHQASRVPVLKHPEIWLSSLLCLKAGVIRVGLKDSFTRIPGPEVRPRRDWCYWASRAALWGVSREDLGWLKQIQKTTCSVPPRSSNNENQCNPTLKTT